MSNTAQPFRHHHIVRAFKAAEAAGVRNPTVQVSLPNGTTIAIGGDNRGVDRAINPRHAWIETHPVGIAKGRINADGTGQQERGDNYRRHDDHDS